ncbi:MULTISPECIES: DUF3524 domain-containing protein [unclassified Thioalkalivibrio]|uniref:tRNA-queuosine alpha-mannosyltransferase domain-containing protein n=1 Tax=unclassified Thioalkalivibrio TaxID=2621013 RepID=UPI0003A4B22D|nr:MULTISPECIES: DUF3524 domain-containing protein [unclassified Thioalkalivibrio]PYG01319.1 glycosyltransferase involved in cell wall biosynthesis [Thioalkalivibrio sp. ALE21]
MNREMRPRVLLLSAYRADSHAAWADALVTAFPGIDWQRFELPGRHFRWRIRGNPISWLDALEGVRADAIVATSMVDLATLRGLHPPLAGLPALYYFHENQFAYPVGEHQVRSIEPQIVQVYGALSAGRIAFNSAFNRDSFLDGLRALLRRMPDAVPPGVPERLAERARVLPVPVAPPRRPDGGTPERDPGLILWNHRWEYDKRPELFAEALERLAARGRDFRLALLGPRPEPPPDALQRIRQRFGACIVADGRVPREEYDALLRRAGIVVSSTAHEFQGLSMLEASAAGARPLVPDALCYPEQYPCEYRYPTGDSEALAARLDGWLTDGLPPPVDVSALETTALLPAWARALEELTGRVLSPAPPAAR